LPDVPGRARRRRLPGRERGPGADRLLRDRRHRRGAREGTGARRPGGGQAAHPGRRLVRRLQGSGEKRLQPVPERRVRFAAVRLSGSTAAAVLCVVAGFAGSVQVAVMARLGDRVGVVEALAFATVLSAALATVILLVAHGSLDGFAASARQPLWLWIGALMSLLI